MRVPASKLLSILAAAAILSTERATAQYRGFDPRADRGARGYQGQRMQDPRLRGSGVGDGRYGFSGGPREPPPPYARDPRSYGGGPYGVSRGWGRGQYLPPDYRGASVANPAQYHLRAPPAGYGWVGDGRNAYLMQRSTGMVLDFVPRAYERPSAARPRR